MRGIVHPRARARGVGAGQRSALLPPEQAREVPAPYPGLVTLGAAESGDLVPVNLLYTGGLLLVGAPEDVLAVGRALALEAGTSAWSDHTEVLTVGMGSRLAGLLPKGRLRAMPHLASVVSDLGALLVEVYQHGEGQAVEPLPWILICAADVDPEQVWQLAAAIAAARHLPVTVVLPTPRRPGRPSPTPSPFPSPGPRRWPSPSWRLARWSCSGCQISSTGNWSTLSTSRISPRTARRTRGRSPRIMLTLPRPPGRSASRDHGPGSPWTTRTLQSRLSEIRARFGAAPEGQPYLPQPRAGSGTRSTRRSARTGRPSRTSRPGGRAAGPTVGMADLEAAARAGSRLALRRAEVSVGGVSAAGDAVPHRRRRAHARRLALRR